MAWIRESYSRRVAFSPNQSSKREQIVEAAKTLLISDGLEACTARLLAERSSFSRSAIHYYFATMEEVIDAAMTSHLQQFVSDLRAVAESCTDPAERLQRVTRSYLANFDAQPDLALLWFDYSIAAVQAGYPSSVLEILVALEEILDEVVAACGVDDGESRAHAVLTFLVGATLRRTVQADALDLLWPHVARLAGLTDDGPRTRRAATRAAPARSA